MSETSNDSSNSDMLAEIEKIRAEINELKIINENIERETVAKKTTRKKAPAKKKAAAKKAPAKKKAAAKKAPAKKKASKK